MALTYLLTHSMEHSPSWEANGFSGSQEILRILCNSKVHSRSYKYRPPAPILSQLDPLHTPTSHFLKIHLNIFLLSTPESTKCSFSVRSSHQNTVYVSPLPHTCYMPRTSLSSRFYHPNNTGWGAQSVISSLCIFLHSLLGPNILLSTLFSNTLNPSATLKVSNQVSKTTGKIIVLYSFMLSW